MLHSGTVDCVSSEREVTLIAQTRHSQPDPNEEGAQACIHGRPKNACPYPRDSEERASCTEGYDGTPHDNAPDQP